MSPRDLFQAVGGVDDGEPDASNDHGEAGATIVPPPNRPLSVAHQFVIEHYTNASNELLLRHHRGDFYAYERTMWPEAETRALRKALYAWLGSALFLKDGKPVEWSPTKRKVDDVMDALASTTLLPAAVGEPAWIEPGPVQATEIVPVANGLLHVPTRTLHEHTPSFWSHHALPFGYDPEAPVASRWLAFLHDLWDDDEGSIDALQEIFGYVVSGSTRLQKIALLVGPKRAGKGTIGRVLTGVLGQQNVAAPTLAGMATNFGLSPLLGRPLALVSDARLSGRTDTSIVVERLLSISGEDSITIDRKYREPWTGRLPTRFVILTNELPRLSDSSGALASRFVILVLTKSFYGREDPKLTDELLEEATGILNWSLDGLDRLNERGHFLPPTSSLDAVRQLEDLASPVGAFVRDQCIVGAAHSVAVEDLWRAWRSWCASEGRDNAGTKATFGRDLRAAVPQIKKRRPRVEGDERMQVYEGLGLTDPRSPVATTYRDQVDLVTAGRGDHATYALRKDPISADAMELQREDPSVVDPRSLVAATCHDQEREPAPVDAIEPTCAICGGAMFEGMGDRHPGCEYGAAT